jgi:hypothetical protein
LYIQKFQNLLNVISKNCQIHNLYTGTFGEESMRVYVCVYACAHEQ